jgi:hypothetical protein
MAISIAISNSIGARDNTASGGFVWVNPEAEAYYNAVTVANGGDVDTVSLYGQTLDDTKQAIDTRVTDLKTAGVFTKLVRDYPFFGGTADTHAINGMNAATELLYFGSPIQSKLGLGTNGAGQYASMNNSFGGEVPSSIDWAIGLDTNSANSKIMMGSRDASNIGAVIRYRPSTLIAYATNKGVTAPVAIPSVTDSFIVLSQDSSIIANLYNDGVPEAQHLNSSGSIPVTYPFFINAWDNSGGVIDAVSGSTKFSFVSSGLSSVEVGSLNTINNAFQTFLGR